MKKVKVASSSVNVSNFYYPLFISLQNLLFTFFY